MKNQKKVFQSLTLILQFGLNVIVPIVLCMMFGIWPVSYTHLRAHET